jgi:hypothetical protein
MPKSPEQQDSDAEHADLQTELEYVSAWATVRETEQDLAELGEILTHPEQKRAYEEAIAGGASLPLAYHQSARPSDAGLR